MLVKRALFFLNAAFAIAILDLISQVHLPSFVNMLPKYLKDSTFSSCFWSNIIFTGDGCVEILITFVFFHTHFHSIAPSNLNQRINIIIQHTLHKKPLHVSAPRCHLQETTITKAYEPTWMLKYVRIFLSMLRILYHKVL